MANVNNGSSNLAQIQGLNQKISQFTSDATKKGAPAEQLKATASAIASQVDTLQASGVLTFSQAKELTTNLTSMGNIAGQGGHSREWNDVSDDVNAMMNSLTSGGEGSAPFRLNTDTPEAQAHLEKLMGGSLQGGASTDFNKFLSDKVAIQVSQKGGATLGASGVNSGDQLAGALNQRNVQVYADPSGNTIVYNAQTRQGAAFDAAGKAIPTPADFSNGGTEQKTPYSFNVGSMTVNYGGQTDTKGNVYGLDIAGA